MQKRPAIKAFAVYVKRAGCKRAGCKVDCPSSKGNQAPHPKFERPNGKNTKSKFF